MPDHYDAIVIGAGFAGLRMLHELREQGLSARVFEAGTDVGGTWYWNRYPGARTDSESWVYCFSFDQELLDDWEWSARFPSGPEVLRYLQHCADRFDLRRDIELEARVVSAVYDEAASTWTVGTTNGAVLTCTYLIACSGFLSIAQEPPFGGLEDFAGEWYMTARWPKEPVDFEGKRVGVVGTGATGIQVIPEIAQLADHLTVFQRTAQYAVPNRNHPLEERQTRAIKRDYDKIWEQCRRQVFGMPIQRTYRFIDDVTPEEHRHILEAGWETGGFRFIFETLDDVVADARSNEVACEFVRGKIRTIVKDAETAELLCPYDHPIGAKRVPLGHHYYETYNRDNVSLVSVRDNAIERVSERGIVLADGTEHELDVIVFAVGFDAVSGALNAMDVRGREGLAIRDHWAAGARSYLGLAIDGFPNLFTVTGPHVPLVNNPVLIEEQVRWIGRTLAYLREHGIASIEPTTDAVDGFLEQLQQLLEATLLVDAAEVRSYYLGANIPGKQHSVLFYFGGAPKYFREIEAAIDSGYEGFALEGKTTAARP